MGDDVTSRNTSALAASKEIIICHYPVDHHHENRSSSFIGTHHYHSHSITLKPINIKFNIAYYRQACRQAHASKFSAMQSADK